MWICGTIGADGERDGLGRPVDMGPTEGPYPKERPSLLDTSDCWYTDCRRPSEFTLGRPTTGRSRRVLASSVYAEEG